MNQQQLKLDSSAGVPVIQSAEVAYCENCVRFCERVEYCRQQADAAGNGAVLGDEVGRVLGDVSLARVQELAKGAKPRNEHEREILRLVETTRDH